MPFTLTLPDHIRPVLLIYVKSDSGGLECGVEIGGLTAEKPVNMAYLTKAATSFLNENGNVRAARILTTAELDDYLPPPSAAIDMTAATANPSHCKDAPMAPRTINNKED